MVLEEVNTADSFSSSDAVPSSDFDPYESSSTDTPTPGSSWLRIQQPVGDSANPAAPVYVNLNDLPRRWSFLGSAPHSEYLHQGVNAQCTFVAKTLQRPVTQDEANALAFHFAKSLRIASYGSAAGISVAMVQAYRGNSTYRFPFWTPIKEGGRFSKDVFGPLRGFRARVMWQSSRLLAYATVGTIIGQVFFGSYALSVSVAGRTMDSRLKEFNEALNKKAKSGLGVERGKRVEDESAGPKGMETYDMARQRRSVQETGRRGRQQAASGVEDDASPTGGAFSDDFTGAAETGFSDEQQVREESHAQMARSPDRTSPSASAQTSAPTSQAARASRESQPRQAGGAWDRLRQGAISGQSGDTTRGMTPSSSAGAQAPGQGGSDALSDSFSFSSSDADRQLAKAEAQRDFDARLERERAGKEFSERGGGGKW